MKISSIKKLSLIFLASVMILGVFLFRSDVYASSNTLYAQWGSADSYNLPTVSKNGVTFAGWYTDLVNGVKVESSTVSSDTRLYARYNTTWQDNYTYTLSTNQSPFTGWAVGNYIVCTQYNGSETSIEVPATAVINGITYNTILQSDEINYQTSGVFNALRNSNLKNTTSIVIDKGVKAGTSCYEMFYYCKGLMTLDVSSFNTTFVTNMHSMFLYCEELTSLNLSSFNTSAVTNMSYMFYGCENLITLDLSRFNTSAVMNMSHMFSGCVALKTSDLSSFNTSSVKSMNGMFVNCSALTSLSLSSFNTSSVTDMESMFNNCCNLTTLDLSSFNTSAVTNMCSMFYYCSALTTLNLSSFNTSAVTDMSYMFSHCNTPATLYTPKTSGTVTVALPSTMYDGSTAYTRLPANATKSITLVKK